MELLGYARTDYLLDATLDTLHKESVAWVKELDFLGDEMAFFYKLLHNRELSNGFPSTEVGEIDKALVKLNTESLDKLKEGVANHERQLAVIFRSTVPGEEEVYRESHRRLLFDLYKLHEEVRVFKKKIFSFVNR